MKYFWWILGIMFVLGAVIFLWTVVLNDDPVAPYVPEKSAPEKWDIPDDPGAKG